MRLTDRDKEYLIKRGYLEKDMQQIEEAMKKTGMPFTGALPEKSEIAVISFYSIHQNCLNESE